MSRLPELERALLQAAMRLEQDKHDRRHASRWRWRSTPLIAGIAGIAIVGGAVAATTQLLTEGPPVPAVSVPSLRPTSNGLTLAGLRVADPEGGLPWGLGLYTAKATVPKPSGAPLPPEIAAQFAKPVSCVVVGRVQDRQLGVVGRDGLFEDDGRFHALSPASQSSGICGNRTDSGDLVLVGEGPPIPASGYTGAPGPPLGGCRERVDLDSPTVSPQTRRKLRDVPQCDQDSLRFVVAGFAGTNSATATLDGPGYAETTQTLRAEDNGAYLFVVLPAGDSRPSLTFARRDGAKCQTSSKAAVATRGECP